MGNANSKWLVLSLIALGCGGGTQATAAGANTISEVKEASGHSNDGPSGPVSKRGSGSVSATVGSGGGSLELNEGPRVEIPSGAVQGGQDFVLKVAPKTTAFSNKESERPLGPTFSFSPGVDAPSGSTIDVSFPLASLPSGWGEPSIAYEAEAGAAITYGEDSTRTKWYYERASMSGGRVVARLPAVNGLRMQFVLTNLEAQ